MISPEFVEYAKVCHTSFWRAARSKALEMNESLELTDAEVQEMLSEHPRFFVRLSSDEAMELAYTGETTLRGVPDLVLV